MSAIVTQLKTMPKKDKIARITVDSIPFRPPYTRSVREGQNNSPSPVVDSRRTVPARRSLP
ncbi:hypothetical protein FGG78_34610 [Thioclava sp. BHET1]|nr:hypothetical protein FGG78_34610 [Thioclava sp. BHET1]